MIYLLYAVEVIMSDENLCKVELLYKQIQRICFKRLLDERDSENVVKIYERILNFCFSLLVKVRLSKTGKAEIENDYFFETGYKYGYSQVDCDIEGFDMAFYDNRTDFGICNLMTNFCDKKSYAGFSESIKNYSLDEAASVFRCIKKILENEKYSQNALDRIEKFFLLI